MIFRNMMILLMALVFGISLMGIFSFTGVAVALSVFTLILSFTVTFYIIQYLSPGDLD